MKLDKEQVAHLAKLARLDLGEEKLEAVTKDFDSILPYVCLLYTSPSPRDS